MPNTASEFDVAMVQAAADRIRPHVVRTPLLRSPKLDALAGGTVLVKAECLQHTGSFKFRGACNRILQLDDAERAAGVVAWSSGNHAMATAAVAQMFGVPATIVMPADAPRPKVDGTRSYGATVRLYDRYTESREDIGRSIAEASGAVIVPPYDDLRIMAGQGTAGLEIVKQADELGLTADLVATSTSGGGLVAGVATAVQASWPDAEVYAAEPAGFDDLARSLDSGRLETNDPSARTICDALQVPTPGELTFAVNRDRLAGSLVVTDDEVLTAIRVAFETLRIVVEPGGAAALAAILAGRVDLAGRTAAVVVSGGNVQPEIFARAISA